ncbi:TetR family transcriptional regulator [Leucobacter coleopterorum]|uniref:TetR family transcriptional regulator n=1 Tax=Leucobacter coleopterorum TaxID=2714933 RepID=A0ABX6JWM8_9MICO|nr:TetR family transcriptional regulator [Leucobacter coleopterorum]QIM18648.1 TetR family transcriptional regulator [Leucobacter coleopterorum]
MPESAKTTGVELRKRQTRRALTRHARRLTIEHGLSGFTVEQVCELAGVSRRTFFNYFPSKEDAVVGSAEEIDPTIVKTFMQARPKGITGISPALADDLITLAIEAIGEFGDFDEFDDPRLVIAREPQLLDRFIGAGEEAERELATLIQTREGLAADNPAVAIMVGLFTTLVWRTAYRFFQPDNKTPLAELLAESLETARTLFTK